MRTLNYMVQNLENIKQDFRTRSMGEAISQFFKWSGMERTKENSYLILNSVIEEGFFRVGRYMLFDLEYVE